MTTPATDGKMIVNALYHSAVVSGLAMGYARLGKMAMGGSPPKLDFAPRGVGMVILDVALSMTTKDVLIKQGVLPPDIIKWKMARVAMLVGGALVNALAFSGSNYLFTMLRSSGVDEERKRHDKAVEQLQAAQATWSRKRTERLDWINGELRRQGHAVKTFQDVNAAMQEYAQVTGHNLDALGAERQLADFYHPSDGQKDREVAFVILGMAATGFVAHQLAKKWGTFKFKAFFCDLISWVFPKSFTVQCLRSATAPAATKSPALWPTPWSISRKSRLSSGGKMRRPQYVSPRGCWLARPTSGRQLDSFLSLWLPHVGGWSGCWNT